MGRAHAAGVKVFHPVGSVAEAERAAAAGIDVIVARGRGGGPYRGEGGQAMPVLRFMGFPPNDEASGDIDAMDLLVGQSVGLVRAIKPAGPIVHDLVEEARQIISGRLLGLVQPA